MIFLRLGGWISCFCLEDKILLLFIFKIKEFLYSNTGGSSVVPRGCARVSPRPADVRRVLHLLVHHKPAVALPQVTTILSKPGADLLAVFDEASTLNSHTRIGFL